MKRNITVNIFGSLYPMDEDAYAMLNAYISNMRECFSRQPDGKEIADDIEGRVAELMSELRQSGTEAISIEHIEDIINRVGKPEQFMDDVAENIEMSIATESHASPKKKLFRDPEHKILGGVFGGLGCYIGVNPIWLRLAYLLILFVFIIAMPATIPILLLILVSYFVCWGSIPLAANPVERLQMKGERVNLSNMCDEFLTSTRELLSRQSDSNNKGLASGLASMLKWCVYAVGTLFITTCGVCVLGLLFTIVCALAAPWGDMRGIVDDDFPILLMLDSNPKWLIWMSAISVIILLGITLYLLAHFTLRIIGRIRPLSNMLRVTLWVVWLIALIFTGVSITKIISNISINLPKQRQHHEQTWKEKMAEEKESQVAQLSEAGWTIVKDNNTRHYTSHGQHYSGNDKTVYLDASMDHVGLDMEYEVERRQKVAPGTYRLEAKGRANGSGAEIFVIDGHGTRYTADIPVCGNKGGNVWKTACLSLAADTAKILPNRDYLEKLSKVNNSEGYGWSDIIIRDIYVGPDSLLRYGVSNQSESKTWDGTWLSATSFELKRQAQLR